jgi:hypothetical protein
MNASILKFAALCLKAVMRHGSALEFVWIAYKSLAEE